MVSPCSDRISRVPPYSRTIKASTRTGLSPATAKLSRSFRFNFDCHWPGPRSLATTCGVSVDVLSCRYLDVSVPCVRFLHPILFRCRYLITMLRNHSGSNAGQPRRATALYRNFPYRTLVRRRPFAVTLDHKSNNQNDFLSI